VGAFQGALRAAGFDVCTVEVKKWKRDLALIKAEKADSRELAARVFPQRAELIRCGGGWVVRGCDDLGARLLLAGDSFV
jgi:hypothetical protein